MTFRQWFIILISLGVIALVTAFSLSRAHGAECTNYAATVAELERQGQSLFFIAPAGLPKVVTDTEALTGSPIAGAPTRGFLIFGGPITVLGLEVAGCLLDPIYIRNPTPTSNVEPGATRNGTGA